MSYSCFLEFDGKDGINSIEVTRDWIIKCQSKIETTRSVSKAFFQIDSNLETFYDSSFSNPKIYLQLQLNLSFNFVTTLTSCETFQLVLENFCLVAAQAKILFHSNYHNSTFPNLTSTMFITL